MDPLLDIARQHDLVVIEDTAQAHGARYKDRLAGTIGDVGCFSFYPGKNLGAYGDAGGLITNDSAILEKVRMLRDHGVRPGGKKFYYEAIGFNHRMDGFQGAVLGVKLKKLDAWNDQRRAHADQYRQLLGDIADIRLPQEASYARSVYHLFVLRVPDREKLASALQGAGIATAVQYPFPLHLTPAYAHLGFKKGDLPVFEKVCAEIISLPMFAELTEAQITDVAGAIQGFYSR